MKSILLVAAGGALGSVIRYLAGTVINRPDPFSFPWSTFTVNITGCLLIGIAMAYVLQTGDGRELQLFIVTGLLGGFTTFSAFGYETFGLLINNRLTAAALYAFASLLGGLCAVFCGNYLYKMLWS